VFLSSILQISEILIAFVTKDDISKLILLEKTVIFYTRTTFVNCSGWIPERSFGNYFESRYYVECIRTKFGIVGLR
jgi:hypothetical protein